MSYHYVLSYNGSNVSQLFLDRHTLLQLKWIASRDHDDNLMLRIIVDSGGCHGYQNKLELTTEVNPDDTVFEKEGVRVVVDEISLPFVRGSKVDFVEELIGSTFQVVENPNAKNSCGCNISYDIDIDKISQTSS
ncbi:hypothetical protein PHYBLDRAFT_172820 [Phycomyces blakesleeanus NRRL 1555(-)]|uniref:Core domain-containing protein n=1 Tax=Phycomyces blakesleeanus (strain ATCC 8743b / DSM 1359 / FGSC 10004 / NBRC 33097 / NRRL 1555) TaxID=763407 RepID=A0A167KVG5_PHYB8|nr:hypothetical protein PHYBLDRAFT_172820 [Phycomyces blakesleeanus NRRL 1555(-)]OAD68986.1 hypothetical protein PHYBLDRAFT_172820 [Phycomyces blakesleeanus NRRL 1555(-)]|eukprot:XP_018287026.1 hypothetical protein PHYBLDRAFT_172820 [Phycomyces blakesleeanus NRRL 1555(-)]